MPTWNAAQYLRFADERTRPCRDLVAATASYLEKPRRIADLGCGPGNSTAVLAARWPEAGVEGIDSSEAMIAAARKEHPAGKWSVGDIATWTAAAPYDLVFSNAALQWVPDHAALYPRLLAQAAPGGALAVQVPLSIDAPAHAAMREIAARPEWRDRFSDTVREWYVHPRGFYYDCLAPHAARIDLWETEYLHVLPDAAAIVEWYRGTGLRPFLDRLAEAAEQARFLEAYREAVAALFPPQADGKVLFPFRRLFLLAVR